MDNRIFIFDTTLRDGEQCPGASMNTAEKIRVALQLERLGVDMLEAGFPAASEGDFDAVHQIASRLTTSGVAALCRAVKSDIDKAWRAISHAKKPRIHTFLATSDIHLKFKLRMTHDQMLEKAVDAIKYAKTLTNDVEFSAEDGSRSNRDFLCKVFEATINAGATVVNLPDTVGYALPLEYAELIQYIILHTPNIHKAILSVHCHNDLGLATANTIAAIRAGARQAEVTMNGLGERAGNTSLEEVVMTLKTRENSLNLTTNIKTELIYPTSRLVSMTTGMRVQPNKAIVGANAFAHESGIHQDGILKNPLTYEIISPASVGITSANTLVLGKHSGRHALRTHLQKMGYEVLDEELDIIFVKFKELADRKKEILDEDLESLLPTGEFQTKDTFSLDYLHVSTGTTVSPMASVKMIVRDENISGTGYGNGPIDAVFNAISELTNTKSKLEKFEISALTGGTDAQGEVSVRIAQDDFSALGRGADPDIITASAKAYINALNRLEYLMTRPEKKLPNPGSST